MRFSGIKMPGLLNGGPFRWAVVLFVVVFSMFLADFLMGEPAVPERGMSSIPFDHAIHGDSIGLDCSACHTGARASANAYMPSMADCMDCHRLPMNDKLAEEEMQADRSEKPWSHRRHLPDHVVFHHGVHAAAGVACSDCHGTGYRQNRYGGEQFDMQSCIKCHRGETFKERGFKPAATYCAACHR
ncbi:quinol:cytochrome c oxidoreductase pentaheme cytochrome subunit [Fibrobacter sp. UWH4]|nr:quinol:cytochrome c oxidoreductase pentaheme cytochrome subunit [Fibrobacter sp. UWH4]